MKFYISVLLLLLNPFCALSQKNNYLITAKGDTVIAENIRLKNGLIIAETAKESSTFKADSVLKIKASGTEATVLHCVLQLYSDDIMSLQLGATPPPETDTVMLLDEIYTTAKMNLYTAKDKMKSTYYFYKTPADPRPVQLVVRYHMGGGFTSYNNNPAANRGDKSRMHIEEMKGYVNQLRAVMAGCNKIPDGMWDVLSYRDFSFKQLIKRYNKCK